MWVAYMRDLDNLAEPDSWGISISDGDVSRVVAYGFASEEEALSHISYLDADRPDTTS
jgi:hypothetical protein